MKRVLGIFAVIAASVVAVIGAAAPAAHAAVNPINASALCGVGYTLAKQENVVAFGDPVPAATFHLMYNPSVDTFCGVTVKSLYLGVPTQTSADLLGVSGIVISNSGPRLFIAGPVVDRPFSSERGRCVAYGANLTAPDGKSYSHETANAAIGLSLYCLP